MIRSDQPHIFNSRLVAALSSSDDGNMKFGQGSDDETRRNREAFLHQVGVDPNQTTCVQASYEDNTDFRRYLVIDDEYQGEGVLDPLSTLHADAIVVTRPNHALFLKLADCAGAVIHDPENQILMVSHLGRHSVEQDGASASVEYLVDEFGSNASQLLIWVSPMVGADSYPLRDFSGRGLAEVILEQLISVGVDPENIEMSNIDTAESDDYASHSEYLNGNQMHDDRFAIVAMMHE